MTYDYICPYCSDHVMNSGEALDNIEMIEIRTSFIRKTWRNGKDIETIIDCSDEWNRYLESTGYSNENCNSFI